MAIGNVLSELRKDKQLRQKDLANILNISAGTMSNYETGMHEPDYQTLCKLADFFEVSTDYLLDRTPFPYDIRILSQKLRDDTTISDLVRILLTLDDRDREALLDYVEMLTYRSNKIAERNNYHP